MEIILQHIMPKPLESIEHGATSIWGNNTVLKHNNKIMLNASSGKGKSTFTHILTGLRRDFSGKLLIDGKDSASFSHSDWTFFRQKQLSVVFQDLQLFPNLTVKENLEIKNRLHPVFSEKELIEMLTFLEIDNKWNQVCGLLSMGQQQRVAIIRALCQPFEWLILDEPFSHLDEVNTQRCLQLINEQTDAMQAGFVLTSLGDSHQFSYHYELKL